MPLPHTPPTASGIDRLAGCISIERKGAGEAWGRARRAGSGEVESSRRGPHRGQCVGREALHVVPFLFYCLAMGRIVLERLSDFVRYGYAARVTCRVCDHATVSDPRALMIIANRRRVGQAIDALEARLKCSRCGFVGARITPSLAEVAR